VTWEGEEGFWRAGRRREGEGISPPRSFLKVGTYGVHMYRCCVKACEKWRVDVECCTTMMGRLSEERQQVLQQTDEV